MFKVRTITRNFTASLACALVGLAPVWADDTEIFTGGATTTQVAPNVLFVLDTSGSMGNTVSGTGKTRMQNMQEAMRTLLSGLNNVNVGLMRFSNPGGPVLYKIDYIDREINAGQLIDVNTFVLNEDDDAQELDADGTVITDGNRLEMNTVTPGATSSVTVSVSDMSDDAEEYAWYTSGDNVLRGDDDLEITHKNGQSGQPYSIGVRFQGVQVPAGATVTNAYITFTMDNQTDGPLNAVITGEKRDTGPFADLFDNITSRDQTAAVVPWVDSRSVAANAEMVTPDLTSVVQEIVDHGDWVGTTSDENDMVFIIQTADNFATVGEYDFKSYDHSGGGEPKLTVEYYTGTPPALGSALTGLRFEGVNVPQGATITRASIDFTTAKKDDGEETDLVIYGEDTDSPLVYSATNKISTRTLTTASVAWDDVPTWPKVGDVFSTPDLTAIAQEIVDRTDWCGGDTMAFVIDGEGLRMAHSRDSATGNQPVLRLQYEYDSVVPGDTCTVETLQKRIVGSMDDVEEVGTYVYTGSSNLEWDNNTSVGLRFTDIKLPKDTKIIGAYLEFDPYNGWPGNSGTYRVEVENTADADPFTNNNGTVDDRGWHGTPVNWTTSEVWNSAGFYRSADIGPLVQHVVNHAGWSMGNDIAFRIRKTSGQERQAESYDHDPVDAPLLVVRYEDDGTGFANNTVRDELLDQIDSLNTAGGTPIQDTLYEAALYYTGGDVDYGKVRGSRPYAYTRVSAANSMVDGTYKIVRPVGCTEDDLSAAACAGEEIKKDGPKEPLYESPINDWCQSNNHIILLTDGQANNAHSDTKIRTFIDDSCDNSGLDAGEYCVKDLVRYMNTTDLSDLKESQRITTHTIGFNFSSQWLKDVAAAGGGQYKEATQADDLVEEISAILTQVLKTNSSFVAPVAAINQFNRLNHRAEIYFAVFRPDDKPSWPGNLKKYRLRATDNAVIDFATPGQPAINPDTGFFSDTAQSAWGGVQDGKEVHLGGANKKVPIYSSRKIYTYYAGSASTTLSNPANLVTSTNTNLTKGMFGVDAMSATEFADHIDWVRGKDVDDADGDSVTAENRYIIGDPLHSKPIAVTYGGTDADPDITVFFGSNAGFLHAVHSKTGIEHFAFIPEEKLAMQKELRDNAAATSHLYGMDSSITPWVNDGGDGIIETANGDFVRFIIGMRRGGRNYYSIDVTDRANPKLMWTIEGGTGDFAELGETWAQPVLGKIKIGSTETPVYYISGGYDNSQDDTVLRAADDIGRAVYIVNAETGALVWSGGDGVSFTEDFDDMQYSIPADLGVADADSDGLDDLIFVGDMGGQLWRFDIDNGQALGDLVTGGVIADLGVAGGINSSDENRRFYHAADIALVKTDSGPQLAVTIGSGYHAHPLAPETQDRFYMIRQANAFQAPTIYTKITTADLYDATDNDVGEGVAGAAAALSAKKGWYFDMPRTGEKVLSTPLIFRGTVAFTTYEPNSNAVTSNCIPSAGVSRIYQVNLGDASPINEWDDVSGLTEGDRDRYLQTSSIIDEPVIICTEAGCDMFVGAEKPPINTALSDRVTKTFWHKD